MKWGNCTISKKEVAKDGKITLWGDVDTADKDFKKTKKITWIAEDPATNFEVTLVELDHLITKKKIEETDDVASIVNHDSRIAYTAIAEGNMRNLKHGQMIQLERRGYFFVDKLELANNKLTLNFIPDGKTKNMSKIQSKLDQKDVSGGKGKSAGDAAAATKKKNGPAETVPGEEVKLSKKELNKLKKKEGKANAKDGVKAPAGDAIAAGKA